jgi:glycosyltransferase involved in cell wall biosynthesis
MTYPYFDHPSSHTLCRGLIDKGCSIDILCCPHRSEIKFKGLEITHLPLLFKLRPYFPISIPKFLETTDVDIVNIHEDYQLNSLWGLLNAKRSIHLPIILTQHYDGYPIENIGWRSLRKIIDSKIGRIVINNCNRYIALTKKSKNYLRERGINEEKIHIVHHPVDTTFFNPKTKRDDFFSNIIPKEHDIILFVGRLTKSKGADVLVRAFSQVKRQIENCSMVIVGEGRLKPFLVNLARSLEVSDSVHFLGNLPFSDLPKIYASCDIFVLPSLLEPFGLVVLEAMSCGKPIIGTSVGGIQEAVKDKINGYLIKPGNHVELAEKIYTLLTDPKQIRTMGRRSRELIEKHFSMDVVAEKTINIYKNVLSEQK